MTTSQGTAVVSLPSDTQILITREFAAPPALVYRAYTDPDLVARWWAGRRGVVTAVESDLRVGGRWRYVMEATSGAEVAFNGEYLEIAPAERLVNTEFFEGAPGAPPAQVTTVFTASGPDGSRTILTQLVQVVDVSIRDMIIDSGMEGGMQEGMDLLEELALALHDGR